MTTIITYFIFALAQISIYFYLKDDLKNLKFFNYSTYSIPSYNKEAEKSESQPKKELIEDDSTNDFEVSNEMILSKNLRNLEFISEFEMYLEDKNYEKFPIEFLQEFEKIKIEAQLTTLKTTAKLNTGIRKAA